jgi:hypothetical protein
VGGNMVVSNHFHSVKKKLFSSIRSRDFDGMYTALDFRCQCTQHKLQSICAVLTFDPQLKNILAFSVKHRYQLNYFICINYFFNIKCVFFLYLRLSASWKENDLPLFIYFWYQTDSEVPNTSMYFSSSSVSAELMVEYNHTVHITQ